MSHRLATTAWPALPERPLVLVPVGSTEQHGPHLPVHTDTTVAVAVAERVAELLTADVGRRDVLVAPPIAYGASGEHQDFPGTVSIGTPVLTLVLVELVRSLAQWTRGAVLVNGHGGNLTALRNAVAQLRHEGHHVTWVPCGPPAADAHAGHVETSLMLHLARHQVAVDRMTVGECRPLGELMPRLVRHGVRAVSPTGVLGDPSGASAEAGAQILRAMVDDVARRIALDRPDATGRLLAADDVADQARLSGSRSAVG